MTREQILEVITRHFRANVEGSEGRELDPARSMLEQGASSLDLVEIVSASMRELRVRVPRTELARPKDLQQLVDLFFEKQSGG